MAEERIGGIILGNWFLVRMSIAYFFLSASFAEYWHGMYSDSIDVLVLIYKSILFVSIFLSLWTAEGRIGGMIHGKMFLVRMSIDYFCLSASFAEYCHGMYSDYRDLLVLIY